jgi:tetratricopeptide (TPR) repeat protein
MKPIMLASRLAVLALLGTPVFLSAQQSEPFVVKSYEQLSDLEVQAERGRAEFWRGHYQAASDIFTNLVTEHHASTALYLCELATSQAAMGDYAAASKNLLRVADIVEFFTRKDLEKEALSKFGKESAKVYRGDPYERSAGSLLLAFIFLHRGDYDNALAACKNGLLADSDSTENQYDSDFTLLHLLEGKCHQLRGTPDAAAASFEKARESYRLTHPKIRALFSQRQYWLEMRKLSKSERKAAGCQEKEEGIAAKIREADAAVAEAGKAINPDAELGALLTGDYNALVVYPAGKSPRKMRVGVEGDTIIFDVPKLDIKPATASMNGNLIEGVAMTNVADVCFQATTRGGREMDRILKGKASFKRTTVTVGRTMTEVGAQAGGLGGLAMALVGAAIQGVAGAVSPEADTRCWRTLPGEYDVLPLKLAPGTQTVEFCQSVYYQKTTDIKRSFEVQAADCKILFAPPVLVDRYSSSSLADRSRMRKRAETGADAAVTNRVFVPPMLSLAQIEKFPSGDQVKRPRAFAPNAAQGAETMASALSQHGFTPQVVDHAEASNGIRDKRGGAALQCDLLGLRMEVNGRSETLGAEFEFVILDATTGDAVLSRKVNSSCQRSNKVECVAAFYSLVGDATVQLMKDQGFREKLQETANRPVLAAER